jgi:hypothetical protein
MDLHLALSQIVTALAGQSQPTLITSEQALVVDSRATATIPVPQWTIMQPDGTLLHRGVTVRAWSYAQRRQAEQAATMPPRPGPQPQQTIDDWRRVVEEVRLGIINPPDLPSSVVEAWGYDVVKYLHQQIERLGPVPPDLLRAELAALVGETPPEPT